MESTKKSRYFHFFLLFFVGLNTLTSCKSSLYKNTKIEGTYTVINNEIKPDEKLEAFIKPYRNHVDSTLSKVLSFAPEDLDKTKGKWETTLGNLFAQASMEMVNPVFFKRYQRNIDLCLLNYGGVRASISKGDVTTRTAFEVMPFENSAVVLGIEGKYLLELAQYIIDEKKPHPLANFFIHTDNQNKIKKVLVKEEEVNSEKIYYLVTNDYLALGGDHMHFLTKAKQKYALDYKLRNVLIDYFTKHPKLPIITTPHIIEQQ